MTLKHVVIPLLLLSLVACGGEKKSSRTGTAITPAPYASAAGSPAAMSSPGTNSMQSANGAAPGASLAPVPAGMDCGGTQPVWVNERSHVFHLAGDPYYGRTKHGKYMCERDAAKAGYHGSRK